MSGTVASQLIAYLFAPLITRIYTPEETAELGLYLRIIGVGAALATARYEFALPIVKTHGHSFRLYRLSFWIAGVVSLLSIGILLVPLLTGADFNGVLFYVLLPFGIFLTAVYNLGTNWAIRLKSFKVITYARISNSVIGNIAKVSFGVMELGYIGLIIGAVLGLAMSGAWFMNDFFRANRIYRVKSRSPRNWLLAKEYIEFPTINLPHALMDLSRDLLMAVLLLLLFTKEDFGLYDLSYQMLRVPLVLIGAAIGQVFFQKCAEKYNRNEDILPVARKSVLVLITLSIVPFSLIFFFGEELFTFVFGEKWRYAGVYSEIMAPWFMINFISSPITSIPMVVRKQKEFFGLAVIGSILMLSCLVLPTYFFNASIETMLWILSLSYSTYLIFVIFRIFYYIKEVGK